VSCAHRSRTSRSWAASATWPSSSCRGRCRCWQRGRSPSRRSRATPAPCAASSTRPRRPSTGENPSHLASRFAHSAVRPWAASSTRRRRPSTGGASPIPSASSICPFHSTSAGLGHRARRRQLAAQTIYRWGLAPSLCATYVPIKLAHRALRALSSALPACPHRYTFETQARRTHLVAVPKEQLAELYMLALPSRYTGLAGTPGGIVKKQYEVTSLRSRFPLAGTCSRRGGQRAHLAAVAQERIIKADHWRP